MSQLPVVSKPLVVDVDLEVEIFRWCGQGDGADTVEDLGGYTGTDR